MAKKLTIEEKVQKYAEAEVSLLAQHKLRKQIVISFPHHKKTPLIGRLGVWLLSLCNAKIDTLFTEK